MLFANRQADIKTELSAQAIMPPPKPAAMFETNADPDTVRVDLLAANMPPPNPHNAVVASALFDKLRYGYTKKFVAVQSVTESRHAEFSVNVESDITATTAMLR